LVSNVDNWFQDEDSRIQKLAEFAQKNSGGGPDTVVTFLESLGGKSGIVYGGICFNEGFSMSHFLIMAIIHVNGDGVKLTAQIDAEKAILKTWNKSNIDRQRSFLVAMELYIVKERRKGIARYDEVGYVFLSMGHGITISLKRNCQVLRKLWENDIIGEDEVRLLLNTIN
jgi:hypothetical protein